jgi:threonine synthase
VAQVTYYFVAAVALGAPHRPVSFSVPTGNFGDIFAGYVARRMGLPVARLVIASNANDILPRTLAGGVYETRGVVATSSPSMDIQVSSNFERYLFEASGRDAGLVRAQMGALAQSGRFEVGEARQQLAAEFDAAAAGEAEVADCIRHLQAESGYLADPHTACGVVAAERCLGGRGPHPEIVLATAHPAKFPEAMARITGARSALPPRLAPLMSEAERFEVLPSEAAAVAEYVETHTRALREAAP